MEELGSCGALDFGIGLGCPNWVFVLVFLLLFSIYAVVRPSRKTSEVQLLLVLIITLGYVFHKLTKEQKWTIYHYTTWWKLETMIK